MTLKRFVVLTTAMVLTAGTANAAVGDTRRERSERRPTITEVGQPYSISMATVQRESEKISDLRDYIIRNGYPDYAEVQEVAPEWPWESYEVRLYYMHWNLEVDFGHVLFSDAMVDLGVTKYQGDITPEKRHEIEVILAARETPPAVVEPASAPPAVPEAVAPIPVPAPQESKGGTLEDVVARLEAAAERASQAADQAVAQSEAALRAADRTVSIVDQLEATVGHSSTTPR